MLLHVDQENPIVQRKGLPYKYSLQRKQYLSQVIIVLLPPAFESAAAFPDISEVQQLRDIVIVHKREITGQ
jgi:hypothetical protein